MDIERARYLVSARGREALAALPPDLPVSDPVKLAAALRQQHPPSEASALAEQLTLRARATRNHASHRGLLYTAAGLEMMTHPLVARRRAQRLAALDMPVADLTAGLGGDLLAVAGTGTPAIGLESDASTILLAASNVPPADVVRADATRPPLDLRKHAVVLDPGRREGGSRRFDPAAFSPPWDAVLRLAREAPAAVVKAPPGLGDQHIPPDAEVEAVQLGTSMRELTLWLGAHADAGLRRAVLLPAGVALESGEPEGEAVCRPAGEYLFDPESCVTRATLVRHLAHRLDAWLLDPQIAYLSGHSAAFSPFAATFEVLDALAFSVNRLRERLRTANWRPDEIRRRGFPVEPDELRRLLGRLEGEPVTLLLTTVSGKRTVFIGRRIYEAE